MFNLNPRQIWVIGLIAALIVLALLLVIILLFVLVKLSASQVSTTELLTLAGVVAVKYEGNSHDSIRGEHND